MRVLTISSSIFISLFACVCFADDVKTPTPQVSNLDENSFQVLYDTKTPVRFFGKIDIDKSAGNSNAMMYPGGSPLILLTGILTHAAIESGVENSQQSKEQKEANRVWDAFRPWIDSINPEFFKANQLQADFNDIKIAPHFIFDVDASNSRWSMNLVPVFVMTQSKKSVILMNHVVFDDLSLATKKKAKKANSKENSHKVNPNEKIVVVVSDPLAPEAEKKYWQEGEGNGLKEVVKFLHNESLKIAVAFRLGVWGLGSGQQVTIKYLEDGVKKIERGVLVSQTCKRSIFESLSGELKSVPNLDFFDCGEKTASLF